MCHRLLVLLSTFTTIQYVSGFNITHNTSSHMHRRRMAAVTLSTIAAIATITSGALDVADTFMAKINSHGASVGIDNFFEYIDLKYVDKKVMDGVQKEPVLELIPEKNSGKGGTFSDNPWVWGDGSAGIIRYKAINPVTSSKVYCFDYFWSCQSSKLRYYVDTGDLANDFSLSQLSGGIAIVISSDRCNRDITQSFWDIAKFWIKKVESSNNVLWNYQFEGYWPLSDNGGLGSDAMIALTNREKADEIRIGSDDLRVAMSASMTNSDKTAVTIKIGPYKKIYGDDLYNFKDWFVFQQNHQCWHGSQVYLGQFKDFRECFEECLDVKRSDCKYIVFGKKNKYGSCYWESPCRYFGRYENYYAVINVGGPVYQLWEYAADCNTDIEQDLGNFNTVDECAKECKSRKGSNCKFFMFGIGDNNVGSCLWQGLCDEASGGRNYNIYVITANTAIFGSKSVWKRTSIGLAADNYGSKTNINSFRDVQIYGLLTSAVIGSAIGCSIVFAAICCCKMVWKTRKN